MPTSQSGEPRSRFGGRHELGQNFLTHARTIRTIVDAVSTTSGPILEIGAGAGALTRELVHLERPLTAIDIDERHVHWLRTTFPGITAVHADALHYALHARTVVGNLPFHLTTPILRRLLRSRTWQHAILLIQWEVAKKRAGIGGGTMMTAQGAPWFEFCLLGRVPADHFDPRPSVDGGLLRITRRTPGLLPDADRATYHTFVHAMFTSRGGNLPRCLSGYQNLTLTGARRAVMSAGISFRSRPRDLTPAQWVALWRQVSSG